MWPYHRRIARKSEMFISPYDRLEVKDYAGRRLDILTCLSKLKHVIIVKLLLYYDPVLY